MIRQPRRQRGVTLTKRGASRIEEAMHKAATQSGINRYSLEELCERTQLDRRTITRLLARNESVDKRSLEQFFLAFNLKLVRSDYTLPDDDFSSPTPSANTLLAQDLEQAVDVSTFYGRTQELTQLEQWLQDGCRVVAVLGMGGIGKTALVAKLVEQTKGQFEYVMWRSLRNAPLLSELLDSLLGFLHKEWVISSQQTVESRILQLMSYFHQHRCLLILDSSEAILRPGDRSGHYRSGYEVYGELLQRVGQVAHQSCLVFTSREKPREISLLEGKKVRFLQLQGLKESEGQEIFGEIGAFSASDAEWTTVIKHYAGNPLALKIVASLVRDVLDRNLSRFVEVLLQQGRMAFDDIYGLLEQQFERLSDIEVEVMYWLAIERELVSLEELRADLLSPVSKQQLLQALTSLLRRSLIETSAANFSLQPVVMEFVAERLVKQVCQEIVTHQLSRFKTHALMKAQALDYVQEAQMRLILKPVLDGLVSVYGSTSRIENQLTQILAMLRQTAPLEPGYMGGNLFNLLKHLRTDLHSYDFSDLMVWQADLRQVNLQQVSFAHSDLSKSVFLEISHGVFSVAFNPDGQLLAAGDAKGRIRLVRVADGKLLLTLTGHTDYVWSVAFSPDGGTLASASNDKTIKLWNPLTGECHKVLHADTANIFSVAFSPVGDLLASSGDDQTVKLWSLHTGELVRVCSGHSHWVISVAFTLDGQMLVSGSHDGSIKLWDVQTGDCINTLNRYDSHVDAVAISPNGHILASGSKDALVRLWDLETGSVRTLQGHSEAVRAVVFSADGNTLGSGSWDSTLRLWDVDTGKCLRTLQGHSSQVWSAAFAPNGRLLASGSYDQTFKLWDVETGRCLRTTQGYSNGVLSIALLQGNKLASSGHDPQVRLWNLETGQYLKSLQGHAQRVLSLAFSKDNLLASGSFDGKVRVWNVQSGQCLIVISGHTDKVLSIAFAPDGFTLASASFDRTLKLWSVANGQCLRTFVGHTNYVYSVAFSPDENLLASGSEDMTVKLWQVGTGQCERTLLGHTALLCYVAFSPQGRMVVSASHDRTVRIWDVNSGQCLKLLEGHTDWVWSAVFSPDEKLVASSSSDQTVKLWDVVTGQCLNTLLGHTNRVRTLVFTADGNTVISGSEDETIRLWDVRTGECLRILQSPGPYAGMNITGATGITEAQRANLLALGAIE